MSKLLEFNLINSTQSIINSDILDFEEKSKTAFNLLINKTGKGNEWLGWMDLPNHLTPDLLKHLHSSAKRFSKLDAVVIVGIGGSYLGTRAIISALQKDNTPKIFYAGYHLSEKSTKELFDHLKGKDYGVIVISKSGTTLEPAIAYRLLQSDMLTKYSNQEIIDRTIFITDPTSGALRKLAEEKAITTFDIPKSVGGRYSILTPVGLLPALIAGINIELLIDGAKEMKKSLETKQSHYNYLIKYVSLRNSLYKEGKKTEVMAGFQPHFNFLYKWWQQLFGESEGKELKGIFPVCVDYTTDLHSIGQFMQQGDMSFFETIISVKNLSNDICIPNLNTDLDRLNFLAGKSLEFVNMQAEAGTIKAHSEGNVPVMQFTLDAINEKCIGAFLYFFQTACAVSAYVLDVNPFDQPGVEDYKANMKALLVK
ncbi:MAG: glucose-6-phosphate isomerase [Bacteroidales bacterium]|nr:glucose-6-phosphate isomerase [Bacteroidales bacterium]